jgi:hypothetical protein
MSCDLGSGDCNLASGCHGDSMPANFSSPVCSSTKEYGKNAEAGFMRCIPSCHYRKQEVAVDKILIFIVKAIFSKIVAFKETIRIFSNVLAELFILKSHSVLACFKHFFS